MSVIISEVRLRGVTLLPKRIRPRGYSLHFGQKPFIFSRNVGDSLYKVNDTSSRARSSVDEGESGVQSLSLPLSWTEPESAIKVRIDF